VPFQDHGQGHAAENDALLGRAGTEHQGDREAGGWKTLPARLQGTCSAAKHSCEIDFPKNHIQEYFCGTHPGHSGEGIGNHPNHFYNESVSYHLKVADVCVYFFQFLIFRQNAAPATGKTQSQATSQQAATSDPMVIG